MSIPYRILLTSDCDADGTTGYVAEIPDLPGCCSQGTTPNEAVENLEDAVSSWTNVAAEDNVPIPSPSHKASCRDGKHAVMLQLPTQFEAYRFEGPAYCPDCGQRVL